MISQVASRYASALFELAEEENLVSEIFEEISQINDLIKKNIDLYDIFRSPFITKDEKKDISNKLFAGKVSKNTSNFLCVLIDNRRTTELESIVESYKLLLNEKNNILEGLVLSAIDLTEDQLKELEEKLSEKYKRQIKLVNKIDQDIIGGVLVKIGNEEIDGTIKTRLDSLKDVLSQIIS